MKSSFKKNVQKKQEPLTYFGHPEFDAILKNSLKKGTIILLEEDYPTTLHIQFERYFIGCSYHLNQCTFIYDVFDKRWNQLIPSKIVSSQKKTEEKEKEEEKKMENQIAWRYNQQKINTSELEKFISSEIPKLDLSKNTQIEESKQQLFQVKNINQFKNLKELFDDICQSLQNSLQNEKDTEQRKFLITNLFSQFSTLFNVDEQNESNFQYKNKNDQSSDKLDADNSNNSNLNNSNNNERKNLLGQKQSLELVQFLQSLKVLLRSSHGILLLTIPCDLDPKLKNTLYFYFDMVIRIQSFFENKQYSQFNGFFHFIKLPQINSFCNYTLDYQTWGIKATSKSKMEIDKLYESPCDDLESKNNANQEDLTQF